MLPATSSACSSALKLPGLSCRVWPCRLTTALREIFCGGKAKGVPVSGSSLPWHWEVQWPEETPKMWKHQQISPELCVPSCALDWLHHLPSPGGKGPCGCDRSGSEARQGQLKPAQCWSCGNTAGTDFGGHSAPMLMGLQPW